MNILSARCSCVVLVVLDLLPLLQQHAGDDGSTPQFRERKVVLVDDRKAKDCTRRSSTKSSAIQSSSSDRLLQQQPSGLMGGCLMVPCFASVSEIHYEIDRWKDLLTALSRRFQEEPEARE